MSNAILKMLIVLSVWYRFVIKKIGKYLYLIFTNSIYRNEILKLFFLGTTKNRTLIFKKFYHWNLLEKKWEYCDFIVSSGFHVVSFIPWRCQITFTSATHLFLNFFTSWAIILIDYSSQVFISYVKHIKQLISQ